MANWWGPNGFTNTIHEMAVRLGGTWRFVMHGPDGVDYQNTVVYDEVIEPERPVYTHGSDDDPEQFLATVTFGGNESGGTELTMEMRFATTGDLDEALEFGADEGAKQTLGRLAGHLTAK